MFPLNFSFSRPSTNIVIKRKCKDTELNFGGGWNAGNNKRSGGTTLSVKECAEIVQVKIEEFMSKNGS